MCAKASLRFHVEKEWTELAALVRKFMTMRQKYLRRDSFSPYPWKNVPVQTSVCITEKKTSAQGALFLCGRRSNRYTYFGCVIWESPEDPISDERFTIFSEGLPSPPIHKP